MPQLSAIDRIQRAAKEIASGKDPRVAPGAPERISEAAVANDGARQGDLYLVVVDAIPAGYAKAKNPSVQLVPGVTQGARHCLDSLDGVTVYLPPNWGEGESLAGPCLVLTKERTVLHPTHGAVSIPEGMTIRCDYQREYDAEQKRERRNAD